jgi:hypothetical protein
MSSKGFEQIRHRNKREFQVSQHSVYGNALLTIPVATCILPIFNYFDSWFKGICMDRLLGVLLVTLLKVSGTVLVLSAVAILARGEYRATHPLVPKMS